MINSKLHENFCKKHKQLCDWYSEETRKISFPIYSSYDVRDSLNKIAIVDANIYPAGFNNICPQDDENVPELFSNYVLKHYGSAVKKIALVTETHTNNAYYLENVRKIKTLLERAGFEILLCMPTKFEKPFVGTTSSGYPIEFFSGFGDSAEMKEFKPDLVVSNNDFSDSLLDWAKTISVPINPPRELGWFQRKKSLFFKNYNEVVNGFSEVAGIDPFFLNVKTEFFSNFEADDLNSRQTLSESVNHFLATLTKEYQKRDISQKPFVFVKNNSGTYGMGVTRVESGDEILSWNNKVRKKMKAAKGGRDVEEVIIQEGIPSRVFSDGASAEPVIYMVGCELAGGFLRTHSEKSSTESLNSPGAVYKKLCISDLPVKLEGSPLENVYGWCARLGLLAIGKESEEMTVSYSNFTKTKCE